jgi:hypothetical protein
MTQVASAAAAHVCVDKGRRVRLVLSVFYIVFVAVGRQIFRQ